MERGEPLDRAERRISRVDHVDERTTDPSYKHVLLKGSYNGPDETARIASGPPDHHPTNAIKRVLKRISSGAIWSVHLRSDGHDLSLPFQIDAFNLGR